MAPKLSTSAASRAPSTDPLGGRRPHGSAREPRNAITSPNHLAVGGLRCLHRDQASRAIVARLKRAAFRALAANIEVIPALCCQPMRLGRAPNKPENITMSKETTTTHRVAIQTDDG